MADKDHVLLKQYIEVQADVEAEPILVEAWSYKGGEPKLQLVRTYKKKDGSKGRGRLGRLTAYEAEALAERFELFSRDVYAGEFNDAQDAACPHCGATHDAETAFCPRTGKPISKNPTQDAPERQTGTSGGVVDKVNQELVDMAEEMFGPRGQTRKKKATSKPKRRLRKVRD